MKDALDWLESDPAYQEPPLKPFDSVDYMYFVWSIQRDVLDEVARLAHSSTMTKTEFLFELSKLSLSITPKTLESA